jgi:hypothetical protein
VEADEKKRVIIYRTKQSQLHYSCFRFDAFFTINLPWNFIQRKK